MPIKKSGFKRHRQDEKKHLRNKSTKSEIRTLAKKASAKIADKNASEADVALKELESKMDRAAKNNVIKKSTASRKVSRLRKQYSKIK